MPCDNELVAVEVTPSSLPFALERPLKFVASPAAAAAAPVIPKPNPLLRPVPTFVKSCVNALGKSKHMLGIS